MSVVQIYQFCRAFDNVRWSEVYQCYISGGYAFEKITRWNHEVPPEIREAVINDSFKLNDNYPPEKDDFALIAREIDDKYSVLAVANRQLDDGDRPTIGYKYFWLEKSSSDIDGIGTLIYWWADNQFQFNMAELVATSPQPIFEYQCEEAKINFYLQANWLEDTRKTVNNLEEIPRTSVVTKDDWQGLPAYIKLHYLALGLSLRANHTNSPNAWAWNVQKIAHPDSFISIFYATQEDIPSNIRKRNLPPLAKTHNSNNPTPDKAQQENPTPPPSKIPNSIPSAMERNIKSCLYSLANTFNQNGLDPRRKQELFGYLKDHADADWNNCMDKTTLKNASSPHEIYPQLIYLVAPNNKLSENWLLKMVQSLEIDTQPASSGWIDTARSWANPSESNRQSDISEFQRVLLKASYDQDNSVIYKLEDSIYYGISYLLIYLMTNSQNSIIDDKIDYLLTQSQTIWSVYFQKYVDTVAKVVLYNDHEDINADNYPSIINFCDTIIEIIDKLKKSREEKKHISYEKYLNYKKSAVLFSKIGRKDLAELLYRISGNKGEQIPRDVRNSLSQEIRREIFGEQNQRIFTQTPSHTVNYKNNDDQGDALSKSIIGFILFVFGSFIFFSDIKTGINIFIPVILFIICAISAIFLTGNPFNLRNISRSIGQMISWVYIFIAVAFLVIGTYSKTQDISSTECNLLQSYETYQKCYLVKDEEGKKQALKKFLPDINSLHQDNQLTLVINYLDNINNQQDLDQKIAKLNECKTGGSNNFGKCLKPKISVNPTPETTTKSTPQVTTQKCSLDGLNSFRECRDKPSKNTAFREAGINIIESNEMNEIQPFSEYLLSSNNDEKFTKRKQTIQLHKCNQSNSQLNSQQSDFDPCINNIRLQSNSDERQY